MHPRLVSVGLDDQVPQEHGRYGQRTLEELKGVSLDIVVMVVGGTAHPTIIPSAIQLADSIDRER
jgi:hypothetical protein